MLEPRLRDNIIDGRTGIVSGGCRDQGKSLRMARLPRDGIGMDNDIKDLEKGVDNVSGMPFIVKQHRHDARAVLLL